MVIHVKPFTFLQVITDQLLVSTSKCLKKQKVNKQILFLLDVATDPLGRVSENMPYYSGTLIIGPLLGRTQTGQIGKVVTLSRWPEGMLSLTAGQLYKKSQMGQSKSGPISKVVRLSGWSHSKVPL